MNMLVAESGTPFSSIVASHICSSDLLPGDSSKGWPNPVIL